LVDERFENDIQDWHTNSLRMVMNNLLRELQSEKICPNGRLTRKSCTAYSKNMYMDVYSKMTSLRATIFLWLISLFN